MHRYEIRNATAEEYLRLRKAVGWSVISEEVTAKSLTHSLFSVLAIDGKVVVGHARVVGDGGLCFFIQDVMVMPAFQRRGIGSGLMNHVMDFIEKNAVKNSYVGLMAAKDKEFFYTRYGFQIRPNAHHGAGMTQYWKSDAIEGNG